MARYLPTMILMSNKVAALIASWGSNWGSLDLKVDERENLALVAGYGKKNEKKVSVETAWMKRHYLWFADKRPDAAIWYRVDPSIHDAHDPAIRRQAGIPLDYFRKTVPSGWVAPPQNGAMLVLAVSGAGEDARWTSWRLTPEGASPELLHLVGDDINPLDFLRPAWPLDDLADAELTIIGAGSIGSSAAVTLATYGVRHLRLVDPDRLLQRNVVRHHLPDRFIGRHKVFGLQHVLKERWPGLTISAFPFDVTTDADALRPMLRKTSLVLGSTDGVTSRRVINHLARRATVPLVLACVLENGGYGEVLRIEPNGGCLICHRDMLVESGAFDPEPSLDLDYGTGTRHLPMTAVGGDLSLVGNMAAKVAVATILERKGHWAQRLPGEQVQVALRPLPDLPEPLDMETTLSLRWGPGWPSRQGCPTCSAA